MALFSFLNAATATTVHKITWLISRFVLLAVTVRPTLASLRSRGLPFIKIDDDAPLDKIARPNNKTQAPLATDSESLNFRSAPFKSHKIFHTSSLIRFENIFNDKPTMKTDTT